MDKTALRQQFRRARTTFVAGLAPGERDQLQAGLAQVIAPALVGATLAGSYAAVGAEIDPVAVEKRLGPHAFPRVDGPRITFHQSAWADLRPGFQGIPEPPANAPQVMPDLLLVPVLAVTLTGVRLGQGRGYYDRALADLRRQRRVTAIALAWDVQIADDLPAEPWDMPMDWVATPTRLVRCRRAG